MQPLRNAPISQYANNSTKDVRMSSSALGVSEGASFGKENTLGTTGMMSSQQIKVSETASDDRVVKTVKQPPKRPIPYDMMYPDPSKR